MDRDTTDPRYGHLVHLPAICDADVKQLVEKDQQYGASWKSRGGVGAFMMLARKWDRLENMIGEMKHYDIEPAIGPRPAKGVMVGAYDIFGHVKAQVQQGGGESLLDTIGDLRRYLLLVEGEILREELAGPKVEALGDAVEAGITVERDPRLNLRPGEAYLTDEGDLTVQPQADVNDRVRTPGENDVLPLNQQ